MRESCTSGSVRGARGNSRPYRNEGARQSRRPSYLAPALSEIVPAGGPLLTRAAPHQRRGLARQVRREFAARSLDLCWYRDGAHGLERRMRK